MTSPPDPLRWRRRLWVAGGAAFLLLLLWQTRYRYINDGGVGIYRVDRWTHRVVHVSEGEAYIVQMPTPPREPAVIPEEESMLPVPQVETTGFEARLERMRAEREGQREPAEGPDE